METGEGPLAPELDRRLRPALDANAKGGLDFPYSTRSDTAWRNDVVETRAADRAAEPVAVSKAQHGVREASVLPRQEPVGRTLAHGHPCIPCQSGDLMWRLDDDDCPFRCIAGTRKFRRNATLTSRLPIDCPNIRDHRTLRSSASAYFTRGQWARQRGRTTKSTAQANSLLTRHNGSGYSEAR